MPPRSRTGRAGSWRTSRLYSRPEQRDAHLEWVDELTARLEPADGAYVGFRADEGDERVRAAYPGATGERLAAVKAEYDPENVFRLNRNITPG